MGGISIILPSECNEVINLHMSSPCSKWLEDCIWNLTHDDEEDCFHACYDAGNLLVVKRMFGCGSHGALCWIGPNYRCAVILGLEVVEDCLLPE